MVAVTLAVRVVELPSFFSLSGSRVVVALLSDSLLGVVLLFVSFDPGASTGAKFEKKVSVWFALDEAFASCFGVWGNGVTFSLAFHSLEKH